MIPQEKNNCSQDLFQPPLLLKVSLIAKIRAAFTALSQQMGDLELASAFEKLAE